MFQSLYFVCNSCSNNLNCSPVCVVTTGAVYYSLPKMCQFHLVCSLHVWMTINIPVQYMEFNVSTPWASLGEVPIKHSSTDSYSLLLSTSLCSLSTMRLSAPQNCCYPWIRSSLLRLTMTDPVKVMLVTNFGAKCGASQ